MKGLFIYIFKTLFAAALLITLAISIKLPMALGYAIAVIFITAIVSANMMYTVTLGKKVKLLQYGDKAPFIFKGRTLSYIVGLLFAFILSLVFTVRLYMFSLTEWFALVSLPFVYFISIKISLKIIERIYNKDYAPYRTRRLSYFITSVIMAIIFPLILYLTGSYDIKPVYSPISLDLNPIAYIISKPLEWLDSFFYTLFTMGKESGLFNGFFLPMVLVFCGNGLFFYFLINYFGFFALNKSNLLSIIEPLENKEEKSTNKFIFSFIVTIVLVFIYPALFAGIHSLVLSYKTPISQIIDVSENSVERINGALYKAGTYAQTQSEVIKATGKTKAELENAINLTYDNMVIKVDDYLDWYYSLQAEYTRILKLLTGSLEDYMKKELEKKLTPDDNITSAFNDIQATIKENRSKIDDILNKNRVYYDEGEYSIVLDINIDDIYSNNEFTNLVNIQKRLTISAGGGLAAGALVGTVASKVAAKTGFKTAAKAVAKMAGQKALAAGASVLVGGALSFVTSPIGGIAFGAATGLAIDKSFLTLEEAVNREKYKTEIVDAINESRAEVLTQINTR